MREIKGEILLVSIQTQYIARARIVIAEVIIGDFYLRMVW